MKTAGLPSTYRTMQKRTTKITAFASLHEKHLAVKEQQKRLRRQAAQAQFERQKREEQLSAESIPASSQAR